MVRVVGYELEDLIDDLPLATPAGGVRESDAADESGLDDPVEGLVDGVLADQLLGVLRRPDTEGLEPLPDAGDRDLLVRRDGEQNVSEHHVVQAVHQLPAERHLSVDGYGAWTGASYQSGGEIEA
ncbi:hypothetical protein ACIGXG_31915 [Streptomyces goshikiensis]|uniref:hypothetical protein n=1 Tax=Streptomyces goshikiensis TaxID=1942 RepID=UPI0037D18760